MSNIKINVLNTLLAFVLFLVACDTGDLEEVTPDVEQAAVSEEDNRLRGGSSDQNEGTEETDGDQGGENGQGEGDLDKIANDLVFGAEPSFLNRASGGCSNVIIVDGFAYAACGEVIQIAELATGTRSSVAFPADDITADLNLRILFTQSGNTVRMLGLEDPMSPVEITTATANFSIFSGISAANCVLVVSGAAGGSNTRIFNYSATELTIATDGIPAVDSRTGAPDVHVTPVSTGAIGFYSQDLGNVANWGIQIVNFDGVGNVISTPDVVVLTAGRFSGPFGAPFGPANFPVESEFLDGRLYVAHFAAEGVEVIDTENNNDLSLINLPYEPTNIGTDGEMLFVVGVTHGEIDVIDPASASVVSSINAALSEPTGVDASSTHIAVADQANGLVIVPR